MATITDLKKRLRNFNTQVETLKNFLTPLTKDTTDLATLEAKKSEWDVVYSRLSAVYDEMTDLCDDATYALLKKDITDSMEARSNVLVMISKLKNEIISSMPQASGSTAQSHTPKAAEVKFPKLDPPKFSGEILDWPSFRDLFKASINSVSSMPGSQKFLYLQQALKDGKAYDLVKNIQPTDSSYVTAWDLLKGRYNHTRELVCTYVGKLIKLPLLKDENGVALRKLVDSCREVVRALEQLSQPVDQWDVWFYKHLVDKLDSETRRQLEFSFKDDAIPKFNEVLSFLDKRSTGLLLTAESSASRAKSTLPSKPSFTTSQFKPNKGPSVHHASAVGCPDCKKEHYLHKCTSFLSKSVALRKTVIKDNNLCYNCLRSGHSVAQCQSKTCRLCNRKHHTLIHEEQYANPSQSELVAASTAVESKADQVMLGTADIAIRDHSGRLHKCRAMIDSAAQGSFITEQCVTRLGLTRQRSAASVTGLGKKKVATTRGTVNLEVKSLLDPVFTCHANVYIVMSVTRDLPDFTFPKQRWSHLESLPLADPNYNVNGPIDIILGADVRPHIVLEGLRKSTCGGPLAENTVFGWVLSGGVSTPEKTIICNHVTLEQMVERFWSTEEINEPSPLTSEEAAVEDHFLSTYTREPVGRFCVRLPLKSTATNLGSSRAMAIQRLRGQERRLVASPERYNEYRQFMKDYLSMGHMRLVPSSRLQQSLTYYMPHHAVIKDSSLTTKLRVVFDASAKSSTQLSLNDVLMVGPKTQDDLVSILLRFRTHPVAMVADVAKMYRQIKVHDDDLHLQRIVWRESPEQPILEYELLTVTYGTASAPFTATRCLKELALLSKESHPAASSTIQHDFYVDDLVSGAASTEEAINLAREVSALLSSAQFDLRKWVSNDSRLLASLPDGQASQDSFFIQSDQSVATLGVKWNPVHDTFSPTSRHDSPPASLTKRSILSVIAKLYDPMGWIAPVVIKAKILMQRLWELKVGWDDPLEQFELLQDEWNSIHQHLSVLDEVSIPRFVLTQEAPIKLELHAFADASTKAFGAAVFIRSVSSSSIRVHLMAAKTKVAPLKTLSIPRLELCAALLAVKLINIVRNALPSLNLQLFGWTDSTIVLAWLSSPPSRWATFVANRVTKIQAVLPRSQWNHVRTEDNPADCASRGIYPGELSSHPLWWHGPSWLQQAQFTLCGDDEHTTTEEERKTIAAHSSTIDPAPWDLHTRYSSWSRLLRITAYLSRFMYNCRNKEQRRTGCLTVQEIQSTESLWLHSHQQRFFGDEMAELTNATAKQKTSQVEFTGPACSVS